jgi:anti-anti-sigma factor
MTEPTFSTGFNIHARRADDDVVLVEIAGELDLLTVPQAKAFLIRATATTPHHLILDLRRVSFLASAGIGLLIAANDGAQDIHGGSTCSGSRATPLSNAPWPWSACSTVLTSHPTSTHS